MKYGISRSDYDELILVGLYFKSFVTTVLKLNWVIIRSLVTPNYIST